ncbi:3-hydroxyacyl-ACP dehydratase FabZ [Paenibacillus sp. ACRRX]|uniref:3-hydroxyacyl-ACP dehydratase FabZ n=1 Tax=unclassified Paenibacillus TaxID=185978 RepID=UPI001EF4CF97|nr:MULTISPECIES: 3-hydroxyacyl-ACP dehydratase FabZ [unclassified Paenibacillus]MCG7408928.1 3-hydroxyacyl-ACP dehydratase FabZ [Paenibacillus sp. ACRRX]MDK8182161.1 3-hydroxyacyl-ACP dehydratase FabZ [Paenibacillus sp. UMB4589-SE434]
MTDVISVLPHRSPFLFVDRVVECVPGVMARGYKQITRNEWFFAGHFPEEPIMPGVLMTEAIAQLSAFAASPYEGGPRRGMIASVGYTKYAGIVRPGDRLDLYFEIVTQKGAFTKGKGTASVEGKVMVSVEDLIIYTEKGESP